MQVALDVTAVQAEMAELGDPGIARWEIAHAGLVRPIDQFDPVFVGIGERHEGLDPALFTLGRATRADIDSLQRQLMLGGLEVH